MAISKPNVVMIAGPNGAGKSTAAPQLLRGALRVDEFVNADVIAHGLSAFDPQSVAMTAGRMLLERVRSLAAERRSFAFETTLASRTFMPWISKLIQAGYVYRLAYVWIPSADFSVQRVAERVRAGGHSVPEGDIRRRYQRSLNNFFQIYSLIANTWRFYDNSAANGMTLLARGRAGKVIRVYNPIKWNAIASEANHGEWTPS